MQPGRFGTLLHPRPVSRSTERDDMAGGTVGSMASGGGWRSPGRLDEALGGAEVAIDCLTRLQALALEADEHHGVRVGRLAALVGRVMNIDEGFAQAIERASALHDIGKTIVPDSILKKPGPLTPDEWQIMKRHPSFGHAILAGTGNPLLDLAADIALTHHERFDGTGYPAGLSGNAIPLAARIIALCDVYDALRQARPYKGTMSHEVAVGTIVHGDGRTRPSEFDPDVLAAFVQVHPQIETVYAADSSVHTGTTANA